MISLVFFVITMYFTLTFGGIKNPWKIIAPVGFI